MRALLALVSSLLLWTALSGAPAPGPRWWKGNTHTHTLWSDGDAAPQQVVEWYVQHGYDFLVLSDHNQIQEGERWFPIADGTRLTADHVEALRDRFGADSVATRTVDDGRAEMRLWSYPELRERFERGGSFALVRGEEITSSFKDADERDHPVHVNAVNLDRYVPPRGSSSVAQLLNDTMAAVREAERASGRPVLAHVNHPNFGWGITWQDLAQMRDERFFEVYNGHHSVHNEGDAERPSTERIWDLANTERATTLDLPLLYGLAVDDAHNYYGGLVSQPGRGWVVVRAAEATGDALVRAMRAGDFYASSGVTLDDVTVADGRMSLRVAAEPDLTYRTRFIGTRDGGEVGEVLAEVEGPAPQYAFRGDEWFVRAVVTSSKPHPNPYRAGDLETAWVQPVRVK